nr:ABC transporter permease [uncultured Agathobaculum sp.]
MNIQSLKKGCFITVTAYIILAVAFFLIGGDQFHYRNNVTDMLAAETPIGEITADTIVTQQINVDGGQLTELTFIGATYARQNTGILQIEVLADGQPLDTESIDIATMTDGGEISVTFDPILSIPSETAQIRITAPQSTAGNAVTLYSGTAMSTARAQVEVGIDEANLVYINGAALEGALCVQVHSRENLWFGNYYWHFAAAGLFALLVYCIYLLYGAKRGKRMLAINICIAFSRYRYLMKQLVSRDFKTKYKRSVLGVLWSFLNPLLTMLVQYIVFSTLFKSDIANFPVYLLTGIVCFSFFSEATTMSLSSIVGNASLITKVYVPKYIYPLTRVMSSTINFGLSLVPLLIVLFITRTPIRPSILLLPFGIGCLFALSLGIGMLLAAMMVFFRDTQFLWGVISMLWMYATPIFYPESIIPGNFMMLYKMNPLYHIIRFIRIVLIDGVSPEPKAYALALIASIVPLLAGAMVFKKTQDRFVLNI